MIDWSDFRSNDGNIAVPGWPDCDIIAEWSTPVVRDHDVATPALLCHKEPVPIIGPFRAWKPPIPYAMKNQRGAG